MKAIHPNLSWAAVLAAVWCACACGCRNQPSGLPNPFLAPGRVPPPATRTLLPGQAQPYYPGDPLPVMQSSITPVGAPSSANNQLAATQFARSDGLYWNAPGGATALANDAGPTRALARSNESAVTIPSDGDSLRFALPAPDTALPESSVAAMAATTSPQEAVRLAAAPQPQYAVVPALYDATTLETRPAPTVAESGRLNPASNGPWRSPQIERANSVMPGAVSLAAPASAGTVSPLNRMDVRLRAVPSPPPEPLESTTPRIRLPSHVMPQAISGAAALPQPSPFYATLNAAGAVVQTVPIGPLSAPPNSVVSGFATPAAAIASRDGFRPRTSRR